VQAQEVPMRSLPVVLGMVVCLVGGCGGGGGDGGGGDGGGAGGPTNVWVKIERSKMGESAVELSGTASCPDCPQGETVSSNTSVPACPAPRQTPVNLSQTISTSWTNQATGESGVAENWISWTCGCAFVSGTNFCTSSYKREWTATVPLAVGTNHIEIRASDQYGNTGSAVTTLNERPDIPTGVKAQPGHGQISVTWNSVPYAASYNIYWSSSPDVDKGTGTKVGNVSNPFFHTGLSDNTTYYYVVTAVVGDSESEISEVVWGTAGWTNEILAGISAPANDRALSIATDSSGNPHVFYSYYGSPVGINRRSNYYMTNSQGAWTSLLVDSPTTPAPSDLSIAIDSSDIVHLSYMDFPGVIKHATYSSGGWVIEIVDSGKDRCASGLALDQSGGPHIAAMSGTELNEISKESDAWNSVVVESFTDQNNSCGDIDLDIDSSGASHIAFSRWPYPEDTLRYTTNETGDWIVSEIDPLGIDELSAALDVNGNFHIIYTSMNNGLRYANNVQGIWNIQTIVNRWVHNPSLALDRDGNAHVSFFDDYSGEGEFWYATNSFGNWEMTLIDKYGSSDDSSLSDTSIAVDAQGKVHISYFDNQNDNLKYATNK